MSAERDAELVHSRELDRLAHELAALGAESRTERNVKRVVPWILSLAMHLGIGFLAVFITWTVTKLPQRDDATLIVADFNALNYEPLARLDTSPAAGGELIVEDRAAAEPLDQLVRDALSRDHADPLGSLESIRGAPGRSDLSQFAPRAAHNGATFVGVSSSNARKIVYAIDASGSMIAFLQVVVDELARSLSNLSPKQSFAIIFFQDNIAIEVPPAGKLVAATPAERSRALKWISGDDNVVPRGGTNPLVAIEKALVLEPDVIFLLSQNITGFGQFEVDQEDFMKLLDKLNPIDNQSGRRRTQINCIQFIDEDRLGTMQRIAKEHGGPNGYKFLSRRELGL